MRLFILAIFTLMLSNCNLNNAYVSPTQKYMNENGEMTDGISKENQQQLVAALLDDFEDIPVPAGYRVDLTQSITFHSSNYKAGKIVLIGSSPSGALFNFFAEQMTANGWTVVNKMQSEISVLNFAKPGRFVSVQIFLNGKITILISPE